MLGSGTLEDVQARPVEAAAGMRPTTPPSRKQPLICEPCRPLSAGILDVGVERPLLSVVCEKSPARSSAVGTRKR